MNLQYMNSFSYNGSITELIIFYLPEATSCQLQHGALDFTK